MAKAKSPHAESESTAGDETVGVHSRPYRRARSDRGEATRAQLIAAGLEVFGRIGYEGASTREIARAADANIAAIVYHFGGKEGLHVAVAQHIAEQIMGGLQSAPLPDTPPTTPEAAYAALTGVISRIADILLGEAEAEKWAKFILREQLQPTSAFEAIYAFMGPTFEVMAGLVATALQRPKDDDTQLRVIALMGQILAFRVANALVLRRLGWDRIGDKERARIKAIVTTQVLDALRAEAAR